ncbi:MAG: helix-turn-helix transcriptional regulator [Clostridia bacterium]|nr:helix-turn-helix transcriptional regulator [Clostridia bacterium]
MRRIEVRNHGFSTIHGNWFLLPQQTNRFHRYYSGRLYYLNNGEKLEVILGHIYFFPQNLEFLPHYDLDCDIKQNYIDFFSFPVVFSDSIIDIDPKEHPLVAQAVDLCFKISDKYNITQKEEYAEILETAVLQALNCIRLEFPIHFSKNARINNAIEYIHQNYRQDINLEQLAKKAYCAKNYFVKLFKQEMRCTPYQYLKNYRFTIAQELLRKGSNVKDVAKETGYSDAYAFSAAFYNQFGIYPSVYQAAQNQKKKGDKK